MARLFTYLIPIDSGAAPNPFGPACTLALCKPDIRRVARVGDWVAAFCAKRYLGQKELPGLQGRLVFAMKVSEVLTFDKYDQRCNDSEEWRIKLPDMRSADWRKRVGDCQYFYEDGQPRQRPGPHSSDGSECGLMESDLRGKHVLVAKQGEFYYFGREAIYLPILPDSEDNLNLIDIRPKVQGFRGDKNAPYFDKFVKWISGKVAGIHAAPIFVPMREGAQTCDSRAVAAK